jgi:hypothetical protein
MNKLTLLFMLLITVTTNSYGQFGSLDWLSEFEEAPFDPTSIRKNKITKVYMIHTWGERDIDGFAEKRDTLKIYQFDTLGRILIENIKKDSFKTEIIVKTGDSTIIEYHFKNFKNRFDTTFIFKKVYNKKGKLIEDQKTVSNLYLKALGCNKGDFHHYKYNYDEAQRLVYYYDSKYWYYRKVVYTDYGKKVETYDFKTNKLLDTENILISKVYDQLNDSWSITETNRTTQVTKSYSDTLLKVVTIVNIDYFPTIKYIEYEYN